MQGAVAAQRQPLINKAIFLTGIVALMLTVFAFYRMRESLEFLERQFAILAFLPAAILAAYGLRWLVYRWAAGLQPSAEALLAEDGRAPVLYLRSFRRDATLFPSQAGWVFYPPALMIRAFLYLPSFEQRVAMLAGRLGPVIALSDPKMEGQVGAARFSPQTDATWQGLVQDMAEKAQMIILRSDDTENLFWEVAHIAERDHVHKLVLYITFQGGKTSQVRQLETKRFVEGLQRAMGRPLGNLPSGNGFYTIDAQDRLVEWPGLAEVLHDRGARIEPTGIRAVGKGVWPLARHGDQPRRAEGIGLALRWVILSALALGLTGLASWAQYVTATALSLGYDWELLTGDVAGYRPSVHNITHWPTVLCTGLAAGVLSAWLRAWGSVTFMVLGAAMGVVHVLNVLRVEDCLFHTGGREACVDYGAILDMPLLASGGEILLTVVLSAPTIALYVYITWIAGLSAEEAGPAPGRATCSGR